MKGLLDASLRDNYQEPLIEGSIGKSSLIASDNHKMITRCFCLNLIIITGYTPLLSNGKNLVKIHTEWMFQCFKFHYLSVMIIYHQPKYFCQWMLDGWEFTFCNFLCCHPHWSTYSQRIVWTLIRDQVSVCMHGLYIVGVRMYCVHAFCYCTKQCSPFLQNTISDFSLFCPCC